MALRPCRECHQQISTEAKNCPHCGAPALSPQAKAMTWAVASLIVVAVFYYDVGGKLFPTGSIASPRAVRASPSSDAAYQEKTTVDVGYTSYAVWGSRWSRRLSTNAYLDRAPNAEYLIVDLTVRNNDSKERTIPPLKLLDDNAREYGESDRALLAEGSIGVLESLNPGVSRRGVVVFDVPRGRNYRLKVSGGFWSGESALVDLRPAG
jgi:hypothetical protein